MGEHGSVTRLLAAVQEGQAEAWDSLLAVVYQELRQLANARLRHERRTQSLQPTALVHEAYLRLFGEKTPDWHSRSDFFGAAAEAMRRILVDHARKRLTRKRGADAPVFRYQEDLDAAGPMEWSDETADELEALDRALAKLERSGRHSEKCAIVKLRYFGGLTVEQIALALGKSPATIKREWTFAKAWLYREMTRGDADGS